MNAFQEEIRAAVREEVRPLIEELKQLLRGGAGADDLATVTKAAKACGLHPDTVRKNYLPKLKKYGAGRTLRISVAELRQVMAEDRVSEVDVDALAEAITKGKGGRRG
ncbi:MAG: hypothetical protein M3Q75_09390 [Gemmatimonadota bacterium]|nr:hypothetical protein [Gemmatimonadota bacterium]